MTRWKSLTALSVAAVALVIISQAGCAVLYQGLFGEGTIIEARYAGLEGKRVAVVCIPNGSAYDATSTCDEMAQQVVNILRMKVEDVEMVRHDDVTDWMDRNDWEDLDSAIEIGRGVKADLVVAIDLQGLSIHEGTTLYQGRADVSTTVYEVATRDVVFQTTEFDFLFPRSHAEYATTTSERAFKRKFIKTLAEHVARSFHDYNMKDDFAVY